MGILVKKRPICEHEDSRGTNMLRLDVYPYTVGRVIKIREKQDAIDYLTLPHEHYVAKVKGYTIFISCVGFAQKPVNIISEEEKKRDIDDMCQWFLENKIRGRKIYDKLFKHD